MNFRLAISQDWIRARTRMALNAENLNMVVHNAVEATAVIIQSTMPSKMHWKNASGNLAGSFEVTGGSSGGNSYREVGSPLPYARRREFGFSGKTDSLGRHYTNDPGGFYMKKAISGSRSRYLKLFDDCVQTLGN